ncbi:hypothetical protein [Deinococcus yavapaiensis]|uniref:Hydroxymethylpyrimidine pyrophosphatase-like HAD family hydrolase n=1 Tax=Deinococcus yavapaiensis KR-236 TaxID=694435 RepID=A0A318SD87_9DEIO|nr:hypothetical protein [Deinococcus yavapaiensis]PYE49997.1 hydroxymethylpyrimidine pyrophosphatase-like HAD family hydrolase [Deinococcus yavapaiensis KR-236]
MSVVVFADLDDTLFQTRRKLRGNEGNLTPATVDSTGEPHSFATPSQVALWSLLASSGATVIPVTGRDSTAMARVTLRFSSWRVLDHGATILRPDGTVDAAWAAFVREQLGACADMLELVTREGEALAHELECRVRRHDVHGVHFMSVAKHSTADPFALAKLQDRWEARVDGTPLHVIANANNVTVLPRALGKTEAVSYLLEHHFSDAILTLGLGDSVSDLGFMNLCDFAVTPTRGQLLRAVTSVRLPQR